jgi:hypothetical protein
MSEGAAGQSESETPKVEILPPASTEGADNGASEFAVENGGGAAFTDALTQDQIQALQAEPEQMERVGTAPEPATTLENPPAVIKKPAADGRPVQAVLEGAHGEVIRTVKATEISTQTEPAAPAPVDTASAETAKQVASVVGTIGGKLLKEYAPEMAKELGIPPEAAKAALALLDTDKSGKEQAGAAAIVKKAAANPEVRKQALGWLSVELKKSALKARKEMLAKKGTYGRLYKLWNKMSAEEQSAYLLNDPSLLTRAIDLGTGGLSKLRRTSKQFKRRLKAGVYSRVPFGKLLIRMESFPIEEVRALVAMGSLDCKDPDLALEMDERVAAKIGQVGLAAKVTSLIAGPEMVAAMPFISMGENYIQDMAAELPKLRAAVQKAAPAKKAKGGLRERLKPGNILKDFEEIAKTTNRVRKAKDDLLGNNTPTARAAIRAKQQSQLRMKEMKAKAKEDRRTKKQESKARRKSTKGKGG